MSTLQDRYINPLTDFGFKKLFGSELNKEAYEESLKYYRDIKNVVDTSIEEGVEKGLKSVAKEMKKEGEPVEKIIRYTGLTRKQIEEL